MPCFIPLILQQFANNCTFLIGMFHLNVVKCPWTSYFLLLFRSYKGPSPSWECKKCIYNISFLSWEVNKTKKIDRFFMSLRNQKAKTPLSWRLSPCRKTQWPIQTSDPGNNGKILNIIHKVLLYLDDFFKSQISRLKKPLDLTLSSAFKSAASDI